MDETTKVQLLDAVLSDEEVRDHLHFAPCRSVLVGNHLIQYDGDEYTVTEVSLPEEVQLVPYVIGQPFIKDVNWSCGAGARALSGGMDAVLEELADGLMLGLLGALMSSGHVQVQRRIVAVGMTRNGVLFADVDGERVDITPEVLQEAINSADEDKPLWLESLQRVMDEPQLPDWVRETFSNAS